MPRAKPARPLSDLEGCVLGCLWKHGASTPYAVRRMFLDSPSSHWSGSAGAVYPLLERLERGGLVASRHAPHGARDGWTYSLTGAGRRRLRAWLEPPFAAEVVSVPPDPLRTRLSFLGLLPARARARFVARAAEALERELARLEARVEADSDEVRAHSAAVGAMRARLAWFARGGKRIREPRSAAVR